MDYTVDISWPQGDYHATGGVIIAATSGDGGSSDPATLFTQKTFILDITNARNDGRETGFYHFNGLQDPTASADYFWDAIKSYYRLGVDLLALDIENGSGFSAMSPSWALAFAARLALNIGITVNQLRLGIYGNLSTMSRPGWGVLEAHGCWLWLAEPDGYPANTPVGEWTRWTILQYASTGGVDRDESEYTFAQIIGPSIIIPNTYDLGEETMSVPIYARGDQTDVWYALYTNARQSSDQTHDSGAVYSGRRDVSAGERAIITAYQEQTGFLHPESAQKEVITIPQAVFDGINKFAKSV